MKQTLLLLQAMADMEFDKFVKPLEHSLEIWRQGQQKKKETAANKKKNADKGPNDTTRFVTWYSIILL